MRILVLNGPNLGILGRRQPEVYGTTTLDEILAALRERAGEHEVLHLQSNHEGALIDRLEQLDYEAVIINPGALTHTSYALHDALVASDRPVVEVHISDTSAREPWRAVSVTAPATIAQVVGHGWQGYLEALDLLVGRVGPGDASGA
jgi:3-dehydroquinate dehydratase-2